MKKAISFLLIFVLLFSLCAMIGCAKEETDAPAAGGADAPAAGGEAPPAAGGEAGDAGEAPVDLTAVKPNEYVQEKLDAGMTVNIGSSWYNLVDDFIVMLNDNLCKDLEALGFTTSTSSGGGDIALQQTQIENFVQMDCAAILVHNPDAGSLKDTAAALLEQGIYVVFFSSKPDFDECGGSNYVDDTASGAACADMASYWLDQAYPNAGAGEIKAALLGANNTTNNTKRTEAMRAGLEADSRISLVYTEDLVNTLDGGYTAAEAALTYDPEIRVFLYFSTAAAIGGNNYITSISGVDLAEFGIFTTANNDALYELIDASETNDGSCVRGTISQGGATLWEGPYEVITGLLFGEVEAPYFRAEHLWATNNFGFEYELIP